MHGPTLQPARYTPPPKAPPPHRSASFRHSALIAVNIRFCKSSAVASTGILSSVPPSAAGRTCHSTRRESPHCRAASNTDFALVRIDLKFQPQFTQHG